MNAPKFLFDSLMRRCAFFFAILSNFNVMSNVTNGKQKNEARRAKELLEKQASIANKEKLEKELEELNRAAFLTPPQRQRKHHIVSLLHCLTKLKTEPTNNDDKKVSREPAVEPPHEATPEILDPLGDFLQPTGSHDVHSVSQRFRPRQLGRRIENEGDTVDKKSTAGEKESHEKKQISSEAEEEEKRLLAAGDLDIDAALAELEQEGT